MKEEYDKLGIVFMDIDFVFKEYLELFKKYFVKFVFLIDNKLVVLNFVVWLGGIFIYVFKGVKVDILF